MAEIAEMWHHLFNLIWRSWRNMVSATGTTTSGFIVWTLPLTAALWTAGLTAKWFELERAKQPNPFRQAVRGSFWSGLFSAIAVTLVVGIALAFFLTLTIYDDHMALAQKVRSLGRDNKTLTTELERRKRFLVEEDPAWGAMRYFAQEFGAYGFQIGAKVQGKPCTIVFTAPPDSYPLALNVAALAGATSGCRVFGPTTEGNPDIDEIIKTGMVPGTIIIHAPRENKAADNLAINLQSEFIFKRSYKPMNMKLKMYEGQGTPGENVMWLQFGSNITHIGHN